eukprot:TRINITY_DN4222_c0_g2_i1.p1 TRINITY_DN4222_c0_g2~~TRINITY_DN4222_c0_g2_i1.p1  ORF type:complete len:508 (-),score=126.78 TRINITY_DN4222_c0_g2_i1:184-1707(-)
MGLLSEECWDQFDPVYKRVHDGKKFTDNFASFLTKLSQIERDYSRKIQSLCKGMNEQDTGTLNQSWMTVRFEIESMGKKHGEIADSVQQNVAEPINAFVKETKAPRIALRDRGTKLIKDLASAEHRLKSAKTAFERDRKKQDESQDDYDKAQPQSKQIDKLAKKLQGAIKDAQAADKKYTDSVSHLNETQTRFQDTEMPKILDDLEEMERRRINTFKQCFFAISNAHEEMVPVLSNSIANEKKSAEDISDENDLREFVTTTKSGKSKPDKCEYEPYDSAAAMCIKAPASSGGGAASTPSASSSSGGRGGGGGAAPPATVVQQVQPPATGGSGGAASFPPPAAAVADASRDAPAGGGGGASGATGRCRALYDYDASDPNELSFKTGEIIQILHRDPSGWWQGNLNGRVGVFPSVDWVEEIPDDAPGAAPETAAPPPAAAAPPAAATPRGNLGNCSAQYAYAAEDPGEINISVGDVLLVDTNEGGWYVGRNATSGEQGRFPSNFCTPIE